MDHDNLYYAGKNLLLQLPSLLTVIGCIVFALVRWKQNPRISATVVAGLVYLLVHSVLFAFVFPFAPDLLVTPGNIPARQLLMNLLAFIFQSSLAIALGILLAAVFSQRGRSETNSV